MGSEITVGELKAKALDYVDLAGSKIIVDAKLTGYIQSGLSQLWHILCNSYADWVHKPLTWTQSSSDETYQLPRDFFQLIKLFIVENDRRYPLSTYNLDEIAGFKKGPLASASLEAWYAPQCPRVGDDHDVIPIIIPVGWEDFVALHAACMCGIKSESSVTQILQAEREAARLRIVEAASPRVTGDAYQVADVSGRISGNYAFALGFFTDRHLKYRLMGSKLYFVELDYRGV